MIPAETVWFITRTFPACSSFEMSVIFQIVSDLLSGVADGVTPTLENSNVTNHVTATMTQRWLANLVLENNECQWKSISNATFQLPIHCSMQMIPTDANELGRCTWKDSLPFRRQPFFIMLRFFASSWPVRVSFCPLSRMECIVVWTLTLSLRVRSRIALKLPRNCLKIAPRLST